MYCGKFKAFAVSDGKIKKPEVNPVF